MQQIGDEEVGIVAVIGVTVTQEIRFPAIIFVHECADSSPLQ